MLVSILIVAVSVLWTSLAMAQPACPPGKHQRKVVDLTAPANCAVVVGKRLICSDDPNEECREIPDKMRCTYETPRVVCLTKNELDEATGKKKGNGPPQANGNGNGNQGQPK